jgi:mannose-6-phosphate isomerase-like protein (cupin superfamily)
MPGYTVCSLADATNIFEGSYPGEMRFLTGPLEAEQVAMTYRRMPQHTGGKGSYGHRHKEQEELYFVMSGRLQFKVEDDVLELTKGQTVRVAPEVARSVWNDEPEDAELIIVSKKIADGAGDSVQVPDFWPE